jgi:crotonobetaine/carnitine-CoA ligase
MTAQSARELPALHTFSGRAAAHPSRTFLVWEPAEGARRTWSFQEFRDEARACAAGLAERGIRAGDFVVIHMENCPEFLFAWFACAQIGAVSVTTNTGSSAEELAFFLADSRAVAALTQPRYAALVRANGAQLRWIACTATDSDIPPQAPVLPGLLAFEDLRGDPAACPDRAPEPLRPSHVQYTSGTTSRPKGVVWTHANALWGAKVTTSHAHLVATDVVPVFFPLFHANALAYTVLPTLWSGGTAVLLPKFSASKFWDMAVRNRCTWANMVTFTIRAIENLPAPDRHDFRLWALLAQLPQVWQQWRIPAISWYGMTETITQNIHSQPGLDIPAGAIGHPAHEYEIAVRDDDGVDLRQAGMGQLWIRGIPGLSMFLEYLNNPEATDAAFDAAGWFDTGDQVRVDEKSFIHFLSRVKDMLRVGEENVAALEVEAVINRVKGVVECAVVGKPDPMLEEVPVAFVVATTPCAELEQQILEMCASVLARFKRPREIYFVSALPKGMLDKTLKRELRLRVGSQGPSGGSKP